MPEFDPQDSDFETAVRESFDRLTLMRTIGASLEAVSAGKIQIVLPFRSDLTQHHGFMAAAVLTAVVDVACGYAAMTLMPPGSSVLTIEYKANFLAPARGERMIARGRVIRAGRTVTVCAGDVVAVEGETEKPVATLLATMMRVAGEPEWPEAKARRSGLLFTRARVDDGAYAVPGAGGAAMSPRQYETWGLSTVSTSRSSE